MTSIYCIEHLPSGRKYIGKSINPEYRRMAHLSALRNGKHYNKRMQSDFTNENEWRFSVMVQDLSAKEGYHLENEYIKKFGYYNKIDGERIIVKSRPKAIYIPTHSQKLWKSFVQICKNNGTSASAVILEFVNEYVKKQSEK